MCGRGEISTHLCLVKPTNLGIIGLLYLGEHTSSCLKGEGLRGMGSYQNTEQEQVTTKGVYKGTHMMEMAILHQVRTREGHGDNFPACTQLIAICFRVFYIVCTLLHFTGLDMKLCDWEMCLLTASQQLYAH